MDIQVKDIPAQGRHISYDVESFDWDLAEKGLVLVDPIHIALDIQRHSEDEVYLTGELSTKLQSECVRCLKSTQLPLRSDFHLEYVPFPEGPFENQEVLSAETLGVNFYDGNQIHIDHDLQGQLFLAVPVHPLCQSECRGLCPHCGSDLNFTTCQCDASPTDSRWTVLKKFKYKESDAKSKT